MLKKNKITGAMLFLLSAVFAFAVIAAPGATLDDAWNRGD